jgi:hypothetical protein
MTAIDTSASTEPSSSALVAALESWSAIRALPGSAGGGAQRRLDRPSGGRVEAGALRGDALAPRHRPDNTTPPEVFIGGKGTIRAR